MNKFNKRNLAAMSVLIMTLLLTSGIATSISLTKEDISSDNLMTTSGLNTETFYSLSNDGEIQRWQYIGFGGGTYEDARNAEEGFEIYKGSEYNCLGQDFISASPGHAWDVLIYRFFLFFDTTSLPDDAYITSSKLTLYGRYKEIDKGYHFNIWVQNGENFPHDNLQLGDYNYKHYQSSPNGVNAFNSRDFECDDSSPKGNELTLNSNGISWINIKGNQKTKFCLRSSRDVNSQWKDDSSEYLSVYSSEKGGNYRPKLEVMYTQKPTASISGPTEGTRNEKLTYTASSADPDGDNIVSYKWKVDETEKGNEETITLQLSEGTHTVTLQVKDEHGAWSEPAEKTVTIDNNRNPEMVSINPKSGKQRTDITFTFVASDENYDNVKFKIDWDDSSGVETTSFFNDGDDGSVDGKITGTMVHKYQTSGSKTIKVKAIDEKNGESSYMQINFESKDKSKNLVIPKIVRLFPMINDFFQNILI